MSDVNDWRDAGVKVGDKFFSHGDAALIVGKIDTIVLISDGTRSVVKDERAAERAELWAKIPARDRLDILLDIRRQVRLEDFNRELASILKEGKIDWKEDPEFNISCINRAASTDIENVKLLLESGAEFGDENGYDSKGRTVEDYYGYSHPVVNAVRMSRIKRALADLAVKKDGQSGVEKLPSAEKGTKSAAKAQDGAVARKIHDVITESRLRK